MAAVAADGRPGGVVEQKDMPLPLIIALVVVAAVWAAGAVWSFQHQSMFAASLGFQFPQLLPLVADGLPVGMAACAFAAAVDGRPATAARLGTALAVAGSATSNGLYAHRSSRGDLTTVIVAVAIPVMAAIAFEVLIGELRKRVLQRRGTAPPAPIPMLRPIRVLLDPFHELAEWRRHVLTVTDPTVDPATRQALVRLVTAVRDGAPDPTAAATTAVAAGPATAGETYEAPRWAERQPAVRDEPRDGSRDETPRGAVSGGREISSPSRRAVSPRPSDLVTESETAPHRTTPGGDPGSDAHRAPPRAPARTREGQTPSDRTAPTPYLVTAGHPRGVEEPADDTEAAPAGGWIPPLEEDMTDDDLTGGDLEATTVEAPVIHAVRDEPRDGSRDETPRGAVSGGREISESVSPRRLAAPGETRRDGGTGRGTSRAAEMAAWATAELDAGRSPSGAELDRRFGTTNYGARVLREVRATRTAPDRSALAPGADPTPAPAAAPPETGTGPEGRTAVPARVVSDSALIGLVRVSVSDTAARNVLARAGITGERAETLIQKARHADPDPAGPRPVLVGAVDGEVSR